MGDAYRRGMTIREVLIVLAILAVLAIIVVPGLSCARRVSHKLTNATQLRGIHQGMVTFSQSCKTSTGDGTYPGLTGGGAVVPAFTWPTAAGSFTAGDTVHGAHPAVRFTYMLNKSYFTPEYVIHPMENDPQSGKMSVSPIGTGGGADEVLSPNNFSYAMLRIGEGSDGRRKAWAETISPHEVVLSDRNIGPGSGAGQAASAWTGAASGRWEGTVMFNNGVAQYINPKDNGYDTPTIAETRYGVQPVVKDDNLFEDVDPLGVTLAGSNAAMVFQDATTLVDQQ